MPTTDINTVLSKLLLDANKLSVLPKELPIAVSKQYLIALEKINKELADMILKYGEKIPESVLYSRNRLNNLRLRIEDILHDSYKVNKSILRESLNYSLTEGYYTQGFAYYSALQGAGININFGLFDPQVIWQSVKNPKDKITGYIFKNKDVNGKWLWDNSLKDNHYKAFKRIDQEITQGLIQGKGYKKTASELKKALFGTKKTEWNITRAIQRIIKTESEKARSLAAEIAWDNVKRSTDKLGIGIQKVWVHSFASKDPRDEHLAMHNKTANEDNQFVLPDGTICDRPKLTGLAKHDINCKCDCISKFEGLESQFDESKTSKMTSPKYEAWKAQQRKN